MLRHFKRSKERDDSQDLLGAFYQLVFIRSHLGEDDDFLVPGRFPYIEQCNNDVKGKLTQTVYT